MSKNVNGVTTANFIKLNATKLMFWLVVSIVVDVVD
jgi:hypothetical protein